MSQRIEDIALESIETIAAGLFSIVSRTQISSLNSNTDGAVKEWIAIKSATITPAFSKEPHDIVKELRLISSVSHANVIAILGSQLDKSKMTLRYWMPYVPYSLTDLLRSPSFSPHPLVSFSTTADRTANPKELRFTLLAKSIMYQILSAVAYLHDSAQSIAHRDIKPNNILLTAEGCVKLIDFGVAWKEGEELASKKSDLWPEVTEKMYFELATGPYRAPELLFGPHTYDAFATDLWSLGAVFAEFFTALRLTRLDEEYEAEDGDIVAEEEDRNIPFILPKDIRAGDPNTRWQRDPLFDGTKGEIGLAWSIFKIRGTPTAETWPTFQDLPDASKVTFISVPSVDLASLLPNLPPSTKPESVQPTSHSPPETMTCSPFDLLCRFLVYPESKRLRAAQALRHPWFTVDPVLLLPPAYPLGNNQCSDLNKQIGADWEGKTLGEWLSANLPRKKPLPTIESGRK